MFTESIAGVIRLKAAAKGVDLATLLYENKKVFKRLLSVGKSVDNVRQMLKARGFPDTSLELPANG